MVKLFLCILFQLCILTVSQRSILDSPPILDAFRNYRYWIFKTFGRYEQRGFSGIEGKVQEEIPESVPFPCNVTGGRSSKIPDSVHRLRPGDIDVIAMMGDSLSAGAGIFATKLPQLAIENRGVVGAIGGEGTWRKYLTVPNILKEFNPNLIGYSLGDSATTQPQSEMNVAEIGAMSKDMPFMAEQLVKKMKNDPRINIQKHWKLISLFIGSNDFCSEMCVGPSPWSILESHKNDLITTLRILRDNLPRTFVSIHIPPNLKAFINTREGRFSVTCYLIANIVCPCLTGLQYRDRRTEYYDIMSRWQDLDEEIANYPEFHKNDFTTEVQPVLKYAELPSARDGYTDLSYMSVDCFHMSQKTHALYANGLWNNLLEPVGNKTDHWHPLFEQFLCPTVERPFLMTRENSCAKCYSSSDIQRPNSENRV